MGRSFRWPWLVVVAAAAALGYGASHWLERQPAPASAPVADESKKPAASAEVKIPDAYLASSGITVEPVATGDVTTDILAPATINAAPGSEALVAARAGGMIRRVDHRLGDVVKAGEVLALVDSFDAATMASDHSVARAKLDLARKTYAREAGLFRQGVTARQDMETAQAELSVAEAEARRAAQVAGAAHVAADGRSIAVVSPINGTITVANAMLGTTVEPQTELFRIAGSGAIQINASVTAQDSSRIGAGDAATIIPASGAPVEATVRAVTPTVSGNTQTTTVILVPRAKSPSLVVGEGVQVRLQASKGGSSGLSVPEDAIQNLDGRDVVFVRTAQGFRPQPVFVGTRSGGMAQIISGIDAGVRVATRNAFLVKAEMNKGAEEEE